MPHSSCDPCCDPTGNSKGVDQYRSSVIQILCASLTVLENILIALGLVPVVQEVITFRANYTAAQVDTDILGAIASGTRLVVLRCSALLAHATTVDVAVRIGFGATNTPTGAGVVLAHPGIAPGSGVVEGSAAGVLGRGASGQELRITSGVPTTGSLDVVVTYYTEAI